MADTRAKGAATGTWQSRAVTRAIEAGSMAECAHCGEQVKFKARERLMQVICNIYEQGRWSGIQHYHAECYIDAGLPYGESQD